MPMDRMDQVGDGNDNQQILMVSRRYGIDVQNKMKWLLI